ncbi:hypothetical protein NECAME_04210 [Necator americanus]|uniref:AP-3 complex subunit delta Mu C-terminal domain-containing protein n=1 Tax=Necator americanus TaxID=51031 RepID=W2SWV0_NECAM|nr:hypothetical protein NECAME_04210 [Necator americanus]ETN73988.1 hypothetical protein NECAME_04210 [Necator americanus]
MSEHGFRELLTRITFVGHFSVVEEVASAASLYATTTSGDPICVLLKKNVREENVHIGCKTGDQKLADVVVEDLKDICSRV